MGESRRRRYKRRFQVRFWIEGQDTPHAGYTTDVSMTGMFIATNTPISPRDRIRVEILDEQKGCTVHGEVVHAARVSPLLAKLRQAGIGIRLLGVDELIGDLVGRDRDRLREDIEFRLHAQPSAPTPVQSQKSQPQSQRPVEGEGWHETVSPFDPTLFSVRFENDEEFLKTFRKELQHGGLFITTKHPPAVNEEVTVEIRPAEKDPVRLPARVVQRREPSSKDESREPPGINVDFQDVRTALEELKRLRSLVQEEPS